MREDFAPLARALFTSVHGTSMGPTVGFMVQAGFSICLELDITSWHTGRADYSRG